MHTMINFKSFPKSTRKKNTVDKNMAKSIPIKIVHNNWSEDSGKIDCDYWDLYLRHLDNRIWNLTASSIRKFSVATLIDAGYTLI